MNVKKTKTVTIVALVIATFLLFLNIASLFMTRTLDLFDPELNTTEFSAEFSATVTRVHYVHYPLNIFYKKYDVIDTQEFPTLNVSAMEDVLDWESLDALRPGDKVYFRVANLWLSHLQDMNDTPIVTLRTEDKVYVSFEDYAEYARQRKQESPLRLGVSIAVLVLIDVLCIWMLCGLSLFRCRKRV